MQDSGKNLSRTGVGFKRIFDYKAGKQVSQSSVEQGEVCANIG
jgi:hypothetical protein